MKKTIFSGIQPSGNLHLGNYLGAITQWVDMQVENKCIFCVVDYHAITVKQDPAVLNRQILDTVKVYLASGIDMGKSVIFQQSDIKEHTELGWVLNCSVARMSDLNKMTQFKDKAGENQENVGVGLYDYPVLMASDILLYNTDVVPVGDDQVQHVELTRTLARRFNKTYGEVFRLPKVELRKEGARIMGLDDATKKMSKSASSEYNFIALTDTPELARKKIMKAATDSDGVVKYDVENKPGISNLLTIYSLLGRISIEMLEEKYSGQGYGDFKKDLAEVVGEFLTGFQERFNKISDEEALKILASGAKEIQGVADATMKKVKLALGIKK